MLSRATSHSWVFDIHLSCNSGLTALLSPQGFSDVSYRTTSHCFPSLGGDTSTATLPSLLPMTEAGISNLSPRLKLKLADSTKSSGGEQPHALLHSLLSQETWAESSTCLRLLNPERAKPTTVLRRQHTPNSSYQICTTFCPRRLTQRPVRVSAGEVGKNENGAHGKVQLTKKSKKPNNFSCYIQKSSFI